MMTATKQSNEIAFGGGGGVVRAETCMEYVNRVLLDKDFLARMRAAIPYEGSWTIDFSLPFLVGTQLKLSDLRMLPVSNVAITAECRLENRSATLTKAAYGQAAVVHATADVFGHPLDAVFAQQKGEQTGLALRLESKRRDAQ